MLYPKLKLSICLFALLISQVLFSQNQAAPQAEISANPKYEAENKGWLVNLDEAYALSKKTNKPIMANFTGSDWCGWCKKLTAAVFITDEFKQWADKNVVLLELDFPRRKELPENIRLQNQNMQQAFQVGGYPTVWVFDLDKNEQLNQYSISALGKTGYTPTATEFIQGIEKMLSLRKS